MLNDIVAHLDNQRVVVSRSEKGRQFVESSTTTGLDELLAKAHNLLDTLRATLADADEDDQLDHDEYDRERAVEVLAALYPHDDPADILQQHNIDIPYPSDTDSRSEFDSYDSSSDGILSPIPQDEPNGAVAEAHFRRQRSRWRRVLRTALPLQVCSFRYSSSCETLPN